MPTPPPPPPADRQRGPADLLLPIQLIGLSLYHLPITVFNLVKTYQFQKLTSWAAFRNAWFSTFWATFAPMSREIGRPFVVPLLQNASGVVLDIGPGSGVWVGEFSAGVKSGKITKIFGVEPNYELHAPLRQKIAEEGLSDVYEILGVGAEDLAKCGIDKGSVDTICTVQCLCSIPTPQEVVENLYSYLKKGGKWLIFEHVRSKHQTDFVGYFQRSLDYIWPHLFDGCSVTRPTDEWLLTAGEWEKVDLKPCTPDARYNVVPHVNGVLTKKR